MTPWPTKHLTADDLDAFHVEAPSEEIRLHLETCEECRQLVVLDHRVLRMLESLPAMTPGTEFADRVMAQVTLGQPAPVPVLSYPKLTRPRLAALTASAAGIVASVAWSSANRALLDRWLDSGTAALWNLGTTTWQTLAGVVTSQPWFETVRQLASTPTRVGLLAVVMLGMYGTGLLALRRLVTPSAGTVSNARA